MNHSDWSDGLPTGWPAKRLKYVAPASTERAEANAEEAGYIGLENIESWTGRLIESQSTQEADDGIESSGTAGRFFPGDVLFGKLRPYLAKAYLADRDGVCSTELLVLRPTPEIDGRFLRYFLLCPHVISVIDSSTFGAKMPRANWDFIGGLRVPIPAITLQHKIADHLDAETAEIDSLIVEKERMLGLLEEKRAAVVTHAVTRGLDTGVSFGAAGLKWLDEIPTHWNVMQLKRTWSSSEYGISESIRDEGGIRVLRMSCITKDGLIDLDNAGQVEEVADSLLLHRGDILFNRTNSLDQIAKVGWLPEEPEYPTSFASYLVRIRVNERVRQDYLVALLNSRDFLMFARANAIPAIGQANLSPSRYGDIHIPLPPREEQGAIVAHLRTRIARSQKLEVDLQSSIDRLRERRSALITAGVTGQIPREELTT